MKEMLSLQRRRAAFILIVLAVCLLFFAALSMLVGPSQLSFGESLRALWGDGTPAALRIMRSIRLPRMLAALIAGAGLSLAGLIMQTCLNNPMASPGTLGVSNAAVLGANLSIIVFSGGFVNTGHNLLNFGEGVNPFATSLCAFLFSALAILLILGLCRLRAFRADVVVLAGIALGAVFTAITTLLQFYATDVGLSAAVIWSFGDLGRATFRTDAIMAGTVLLGVLFASLLSWKFNALLGGDESAASLGVRVPLLRFAALLAASLITAVCVSFLGVIGFVGIICPHIAKRLLGQDHRFSIPGSLLLGSILLLAADTLGRAFGSGAALPAGAVTALLGAPFFLFLIFARKGGNADA